MEISKPRSTVLKRAGQHLAKFRASQALIQMALNMALLPCARLCAKHITCLLPTATFLWSKVVPRSKVADRGGTPTPATTPILGKQRPLEDKTRRSGD